MLAKLGTCLNASKVLLAFSWSTLRARCPRLGFVVLFRIAKRLNYSCVIKFLTIRAKMIFDVSLVMLVFWCFSILREIEVQ